MKVRAQRRTQNGGKGSKAHSKRGRVRKTHYPRGEGLKAHQNGARVRKRTTKRMRAQRHTQKEVGLENALPKG